MANYHPSLVIKGQMAELNDLMKDIVALDTEITTAAPHKRLILCLEMMEKTSQIEALKENIQCKIEALDIHRKRSLASHASQLHEITNVRGCTVDATNVKNTKVATTGTALKVPEHGDEESVG